MLLPPKKSRSSDQATLGPKIPGSKTVVLGSSRIPLSYSLRNSLEGGPSINGFFPVTSLTSLIGLGKLPQDHWEETCVQALFLLLCSLCSQDHRASISSHLAGKLDGGKVTTLGVSNNRPGDSSTNVKLKRVLETGGGETESAQATPVAGVWPWAWGGSLFERRTQLYKMTP